MKLSKSKLTRLIIQILFFSYVFLIVFVNYMEDKGLVLFFDSVDLHAICPFGAVESIGRLILTYKFIPKIHESNFWILIGSISSTVLFGALFCGWLCPLGSIQDWIYRFGKMILRKRVSIPTKLDSMLGYLRYVVLILIIFQTTRHLSLVFTKVDPYYALFHFWTGEALPVSIIMLCILLLISLFIERPWCRWFCPFGAVQGIIQFLSPWKIRRNSFTCINCNKCSKICPMKIDVAQIKSVKDTRCNRCGECLDSCPVDSTLDFKTPFKFGLSIKDSLVTGLIVLTLFFAPVIFAKTLGLFKTSNKVVVITGTLIAEEIKGAMTILELSEGFGITIDQLYEYLNITKEISVEEKIRNIEDIQEEITLPVIRDKMSLWH